jgi:hypothetical protein
LITHPIADRIAQVAGDGELVGRLPGARRWGLDPTIAVVRDPGSFDGDFAEDGLEGEGSRPSASDALAAVPPPLLEDELLVGLLDEGAEELALDLEPGAMDAGRDPVGEMLVLIGHR